MDLTKNIESLPSTKPQTIKRLQAAGITTYFDVVRYCPFRYEDYSHIKPIGTLQEGELVTIQGTIATVTRIPTRSRVTIQKITVSDETGQIEVTWFNQPYILMMLKKGLAISIAGAAKYFGSKLTFEPKEWELIKDPAMPLRHTAKIIPVYPTKYGLSTHLIREKISLIFENYIPDEALDKLEFLPPEMVTKYKLLPEGTAYKSIHFPENESALNKARYRLGFDELFLIQTSSLLVKKEWDEKKVGTPFKVTTGKVAAEIDKFTSNLPFKLTGAQKKVLEDIKKDLQQETPMNRFVQGDVGSGKTVIAAIAALIAHGNKKQTLFMAPTEILAQQHFNTLTKLFQHHELEIGIHTRSYKTNTDNPDIIVGTHALLSEKLKLSKIGLIIIDEQHRFGVAQRALLKEKGHHPHLLTMTATPIPRTVALTLYGELDLSVIDEMPVGRLPIKTAIVPEQKRTKAYDWIKDQIKTTGTQVFIICPLIEESDAETMLSVKAASKEYEYLRKEVFKKEKVALIHGKMKSKEKEEVMQAFKDKKYDVLVSTSVVEVGIDIPNATIMIIEGAERYGLAQLHQLRGRVGRAQKQSFCFLFTSPEANAFSRRLKFFCSTTSGMKLAEFDLENRGAGELYGTRQSGMETLQFSSLTDLPIIETTKKAAEYCIKTFDFKQLPLLKERIDSLQMHRIAKD